MGFTDLLMKMGILKKADKSSVTMSGVVPNSSGSIGRKKTFDFNIYMKAVNIFFRDFFGKKLPYFFKNLGSVINGSPAWWGTLPQDEQIAYGVLLLGKVMLVTGIVLVIVL